MSDAEQHSVVVTFFANYAATTKREEIYTLGALVSRILAVTKSSKDKLPWLKLLPFWHSLHRKGLPALR